MPVPTATRLRSTRWTTLSSTIRLHLPLLVMLLWFAAPLSALAELPHPAISVHIQHDADSTKPGDIVTYTIAVNNSGAVTAYALAITDIVPPELRYLPGSGLGGDTVADADPAGSGIVWTIASLEPAKTAILSFQAVVR